MTETTVFRLRVFAEDTSLCALVKFSPSDFEQLAKLKRTVEHVASEVSDGFFEGLSLWNCFTQVWLEDEEYEAEVEVEWFSEAEAEELWPTPFWAETFNNDDCERTEYDLVLLDKYGVTFRADLKHTDTTVTSATIPWSRLLGDTL